MPRENGKNSAEKNCWKKLKIGETKALQKKKKKKKIPPNVEFILQSKKNAQENKSEVQSVKVEENLKT